MAFDSLSDAQLAADTLAKANELENGAQAVMRATVGTAAYDKANLLENKAQAVMRRAAEMQRRLAPAPAPTLEGVLIVGQSHSANYVDYWAGAIRRDNPNVKWLPHLNASGAGIKQFETWLPEILVSKAAVVVFSIIPEDLIASLARYNALFEQVAATGAYVVANNPWATRTTTPAQRQVVLQHVDAIADFAGHPVLGVQGADDNPALYRDAIHWSVISGQGGHAYAYAIWSKALAQVAPVKAYPDPATPASPAPELPPVEPEPAPGEPITKWVGLQAPVVSLTDEQIRARLRTTGNAPDQGADPVGAFRLTDDPTWSGLIDPFFRPGQKRAGHHHIGFGNTLMDADATYESIRAAGTSSGAAGEMDRGGFWLPTPFARDKATGERQYPRGIKLIRYYKAVPDVEFWPEISARSPAFAAWVAALHPQNREWYEFHRLAEIPAGLRFIIGVTNGTNRIVLHKADGTPAISARTFADLAPRMAVGDLLVLETVSSPLWDGKHIDSPDHISHMANETRDGNWRLVTNPAYPVRLPVVSLKFNLYVEAWMDLATLALSSCLQNGRAGGSTLHAEYAEGWEPAVKTRFHRGAINGHKNCSAGDLGDGFGCPRGPALTDAEKVARFPDSVPFV